MSDNTATKSRAAVICVLVIGFVMYGQSIMSSTIANIIAEMPEWPATTISMIQTYPTLGVIVASLGYGALSRKLSNKTLLIAATILYAGGGIGVIFMGHNLPLIFACRVILGLGCGVYCAMAPALIAAHFPGNSGASTQGLLQAIAGAGTVVFQTASGWICVCDWRMACWLSALCIVACIVALIFMPKPTASSTGAAAAEEQARLEAAKKRKELSFFEKYPPIVIAYWIEMFFFMGGIVYVMMNSSILAAAVGCTSVEAAYALNAHTIVGLVAGVTFGVAFKGMREYTLAVASIVGVVAFFLLGTATGIVQIYIGAGIMGVGASWVVASCSQLIGKYAHPVASGMAISTMVALQFGSQFLSPFWVPIVCNMFGMDASLGFAPFLVYAVIYAVLAVAFIAQAATGMKKRQAKVESGDPQ